MQCKKLTIFEGPDGSGKTTLAKRYAKETGAHYVHFGPELNMDHGIIRIYVDAMMPALMGYQNVVFDRSWLSEYPYGHAYRDSRIRILPTTQHMVERLAMRCGAVVVFCDPGWDVVRANFIKRKGEEMLDNEDQLNMVHTAYLDHDTNLPFQLYDYNNSNLRQTISAYIDNKRMPCHDVASTTVGNIRGSYAIVCDGIKPRLDHDTWIQWQFGSLSRLTHHRIAHNIALIGLKESDILWVGIKDVEVLHGLSMGLSKIIAVGPDAAEACYRHKILCSTVPDIHSDINNHELFKQLTR